MADKIRKLTLVDRINHYKGYALGNWKAEVAKQRATGLNHDEAVMAVLAAANVPTTGIKINPHVRVNN